VLEHAMTRTPVITGAQCMRLAYLSSYNYLGDENDICDGSNTIMCLVINVKTHYASHTRLIRPPI
jgi:hypothetical protein